MKKLNDWYISLNIFFQLFCFEFYIVTCVTVFCMASGIHIMLIFDQSVGVNRWSLMSEQECLGLLSSFSGV